MYKKIIYFLETEELPADHKRARKVALQALSFVLDNGVLYYIDPKQGH